MDIVITGSVAYDYLMTFPGHFKEHIIPDKIENLSLSFLVETLVRRRGGIAANIAYTLALLGDRPKVMATVGEDFSEYAEWLEKNGVDTSTMKVVPGKFTASFFATTDRNNSQMASFYPGAMAHAAELSLRELKGKTPDLVVISPNDPAAMEKYIQECKELGLPHLYDPSQQIVRVEGDVLREGIEGAKALFVNEYEYSLICKKTGMSKEDILGNVEFMVVTLGEKGAMIYNGADEHKVAAVQTGNIADPTGVGDAFRGGFLTGLSRGWDWETCGKLGALAATYCLEAEGPQDHAYTREDFVKRFRENFGDIAIVNTLLK